MVAEIWASVISSFVDQLVALKKKFIVFKKTNNTYKCNDYELTIIKGITNINMVETPCQKWAHIPVFSRTFDEIPVQ